ERVAAVEVDFTGQVRRRKGGRYSVGVKARGVGALAIIVVEIELDRDALGNPAGSAGSIRAVAQPAASGSERGRAGVLDGEGDAVRLSIAQLEGEIVGEILDIHWRVVPGAARFVR